MTPTDPEQEKQNEEKALRQEAARNLRKLGKDLAEEYPKHASAETLANEAADRLDGDTDKLTYHPLPGYIVSKNAPKPRPGG